MNIGKNIHNANKKKAYRKPVLEVVEVDRVILLEAGVSGDGGPPDDPSPPGVQSFQDSGNTLQSNPPSKSTNPFGGGAPEYER